MKVLIVTDSMDIGGAETHIFTLIKELVKSNISITLLTSGGVYAASLSKCGVRCVHAPLEKRDAISIRRSAAKLREEMAKADIVHTHTRFSSFLAGKIRGKRSYPPIVTTAHLNFPLFPFGALAFWGECTLAVSEDIKDYLKLNYRISESSIKLTRNSIDTSLFSKNSFSKKLIIHTSRIDKGRAKTAFLLAEIAPSLLSKFKDYRIMIAGDGNMFKKLEAAVKKANEILGFEGVILCGARGDIPSLLRYGSIFVGVSRSALEGMASGLATIISGDEGYGGILSNDNFNLLSSTNFCARGLPMAENERLLSDVEFLIKNDKIRTELSDFSRKIIEDKYSSQIMANDALDVYRNIKKMPRVALLGFFGYSNLGDEATLRVAVNELFSHGIADISALVSNSSCIREEFPFVKTYDRMNPGDIAAALDNADILIMCGGNLLQNETSRRSLLYYEEIMLFAKRRGLRIYMISSGFGEIYGNIGNLLLKRSITSASFCGCRTEYDLGIAKMYNPNCRLMPDLCFLLPEINNKRNPERLGWIVSSKRLVSAKDIKNIAEKRNLTPIAILLFKNEDERICDELKENGIAFYIPNSYADFSEILKDTAFTISERLHGSIFSIMCHTPTYLTDNSSKKRALIEEIKKSSHEGEKIISKYDPISVLSKKEIGVQDSDFSYVINSLKCEISNAFNYLFS